MQFPIHAAKALAAIPPPATDAGMTPDARNADPLPVPGGMPVFDATALEGLIRLDQTSPGLLAALVRRFLPDAHGLIEQLTDSLDAPGAVPVNAQDMGRAAHSLKSTCARFGAAQVVHFAEQAERAAASGETAQARDTGMRLRAAFALFEQAFKQHPAIQPLIG